MNRFLREQRRGIYSSFLFILLPLFCIVFIVMLVSWLRGQWKPTAVAAGLGVIVLGLHNYLYIRQLDKVNIARAKQFWIPSMAQGLSLFCSFAFAAATVSQLDEGQEWLGLQLVLFSGLGALSALFSLTLPIIIQRRYLGLAARRERYKRIVGQIEEQLFEEVEGELSPAARSQSPPSISDQLGEIAKLLRLQFYLEYRSLALEESGVIDYIQWVSVLIGPCISLVIYFLEVSSNSQ